MEVGNRASQVGVLHLLPLELWEAILDKVCDPDDMQNIFQAFPELSILFKEKKFCWLIDQVLPLFSSKSLAVEDILNCRLASKRWRNAVNLSLETHPDRLPYNSTEVGIITETHFNYSRVPNLKANFRKMLNSGLDNLASLSNPVPGRYLEIFVKGNTGDFEMRQASSINLSDAVPFLEKFGDEIWFLRIELSHSYSLTYNYHSQTIKGLFDCLSLLPNLKSLKLHGSFPYNFTKLPKTDLYAYDIAAEVEKVDLLDIQMNEQDAFQHHQLIAAFVNHDQVKQLGINGPYWIEEYGRLFPNLVQLHLETTTSRPTQIFKKIIRQLQAPRLRKIRFDCVAAMDICQLLKILKPLNIECLELVGSDLMESSGMLHGTIPSLTILKIKGNPFLKYEFLETLPSLEYLTIDQCYTDWDMYRQRYRQRNHERKHNLGETLCRFYFDSQVQPQNFSWIWDNFPQLKMLTVIGHEDGSPRQYIREDKDTVFKQWKQYPLFSPFFDDD